jgi:hypothetical protein
MLRKATQVQVTEDMIEQEHAVTGLCGQHTTVSLIKKPTFFTDEGRFHQSGCISSQNSR